MVSEFALHTAIVNIPQTNYFLLINNPYPIAKKLNDRATFRYVALPDRVNVLLSFTDDVDEKKEGIADKLLRELPVILIPSDKVIVLKAIKDDGPVFYGDNITPIGEFITESNEKYILLHDCLFRYDDLCEAIKAEQNEDHFRIKCITSIDESNIRLLTDEEKTFWSTRL